jgi:cell division transport system permease protein
MRVIKSPFEHLLNILVIAVIIAILNSVMIIAKNSEIWQENNLLYPQIMIYLNATATQTDVSVIESSINKYNQKLIKNYQFISKSQGLLELQADEQLKQIASDVISSNDNPLPDILIVNTASADKKLLAQLVNKIAKLPMVDDVQIDINYASKISDLISFIKKIAGLIQVLFVMVLILVIYNMVRLQMLLRHDEITVSRLIGASDSFIMRPLAYYAVLQVILASGIAFVLVNWFINFINHLFLSFSTLFGHAFLLTNLTPTQLTVMLLILIIFTIFAVFLAVRWVFSKSYSR